MLIQRERQKSGDERTRKLLARSHWQIDLSRDLLDEKPLKTRP